MADLNDLQSAQTIKIVGADSTGSETQFIASYDARLLTSSVPNRQVAFKSEKGNNNVIINGRAGTSNLPGRQYVIIQTSSANCFFGFNNVVNEINYSLPANQAVTIQIGDQINLFLVKKSGGGSATFNVTEIA